MSYYIIHMPYMYIPFCYYYCQYCWCWAKPKGILGREGWPREVSKPSPSRKTPLSKYIAPTAQRRLLHIIRLFCMKTLLKRVKKMLKILYCLIIKEILEKHTWQTKVNTAQKAKFSIKNFFGKFNQINRKLRIWSFLLKKCLMENFIFVQCELIDL